MRFTPGQRRLELAASEFARFGEPPSSSVFAAGGRWRAEAGREWHDALRKEIEATQGSDGSPVPAESKPETRAPDASSVPAETPSSQSPAPATAPAPRWTFEIPVRAILVQDRWTLAVEGRADQILLPADPAAPIVVREVKTVTESLPQPPAYWRENRPAFFSQLALYCLGLAQQPEHATRTISGVLLLVEPATGVMQEVPLDTPPAAWLEPQARLLAQFAESRWNSRLRLEHLRLLNPFIETRAEWTSALQRLSDEPARTILLEAPTGFGKTSLALVDALQRLRGGTVSRIVYSTGKNSGRLQVLRELERLVVPGALRTFTLNSRAEHDVPGIPTEPEIWRDNWRRAAIDPEHLFNEDRVSLDALRALGTAAAVPPWEITKVLLPLAEFILCDYNYLFSPWQAGVLGGIPGWDPAATLLIVDEAHNLPARTAEARSITAEAAEAFDALDALRDAGASRDWLRHWEAWVDFLDELGESREADLHTLYLARDLCIEITRLWEERPPFRLELEQPVMDALEQPAQLLPLLQNAPPVYLFRSPRARTFRAACLDASAETGETLCAFQRALLMSATLSPAEGFADACGLAGAATAWIPCDAPWRTDAYNVIVDARVDTRLTTRERHYRTTAETVLSFAATDFAAVFFPSYAYAETILTYLRALDPGFRVALQPRGATPAQNAGFLEEALRFDHAVFLVTGGGLAESVDLLGGRVTRAMIVSPCLPEVSPERAAQMSALERGGAPDAFRSVYLIPAMRKVNQALGRLVRGPGQRATIVLHCRRFAEAATAGLLAPEYRGGKVVRTDAEWAETCYA